MRGQRALFYMTHCKNLKLKNSIETRDVMKKNYLTLIVDVTKFTDDQAHTLCMALLAQLEGLPVEGVPTVEIDEEDDRLAS